jgi:hypothetical protein
MHVLTLNLTAMPPKGVGDSFFEMCNKLIIFHFHHLLPPFRGLGGGLGWAEVNNYAKILKPVKLFTF